MLVRKSFQGPSFLTFSSLMSWEANPAELSGGSSGEGTDTSQESESQGQESGYSSFVQELLKDAPPEHVKIMEPYIKKFDAGSTRRFQDLRNQYKHYDNLGWDEETTTQMAEVYRLLNEDPQVLYEALRSELESGEQNEESAVGDTTQSVQGLPPELKAQFDQQQEVLQALAQYVLDEHSSKQQAVEDEEFTNYLELLKQEYGEFDEEYVVTRISSGMDGEAAVKDWFNKLDTWVNKVNQSTSHLPSSVLSSAGGGAVPQQEQQKLGSIPDKDIRNLIANVMNQANQASQ